MVKCFPLEFIRVILEQTLLKEHIANTSYFGGSDQVKLTSFFEQLKNQDEIDRFVETYRDLADEQNRSGLIGNGILTTTENPTITNLYTSMIIPMTWACTIRCKLSNRDQMADTLFHLIDELKGSKVDVAELVCRDDNNAKIYVPFMVGTVGHNLNKPRFELGNCTYPQVSNNQGQFGSLDTFMNGYLFELEELGIENNLSVNDYFYVQRYSRRYIPAGHGLPAHWIRNQRLSVAIKTADKSYVDLAFSTTQVEDTYTGLVNKKAYGFVEMTLVTSNTFTSEPESVDLSATCDYAKNGVSKTFTSDPEQTTISSITLENDGHLTIVVKFGFRLVAKGYTYDGIDSIEGTALTSDDTFDLITDDGTRANVIFPPSHEDYTKYKVSLSFDSLRLDQPRTINGDEYCEFSFGGSATIVSEDVKLGNNLVKVNIQKDYVMADDPIPYDLEDNYLEPLELPSGLGANTIPSQLASNFFKVNSHTDSMTPRLQYSFVLDESQDLLKQWFEYGRYGITEDITPNIIYQVSEYWSSWGVVKKYTTHCKLVESIDVENTESDTLTLGVTFQVQGENN